MFTVTVYVPQQFVMRSGHGKGSWGFWTEVDPNPNVD